MTDSEARDIVNGAALVIAAIYFYRKLIEPATTEGAATGAGGKAPGGAGNTPEPVENEPVLTRWRGPAGSGAIGATPGEPATVGGAAAQLFGQGKLPSTERFVVGWGFVFIVLSLAVDASPELAASFAALAALGSVLGNGVAVSKDLHTQLSKAPQSAADAASQAPSTPTTLVSFAGTATTSAATLMPEPTTPNRRRNGGKRRTFKVESA